MLLKVILMPLQRAAIGLDECLEGFFFLGCIQQQVEVSARSIEVALKLVDGELHLIVHDLLRPMLAVGAATGQYDDREEENREGAQGKRHRSNRGKR